MKKRLLVPVFLLLLACAVFAQKNEKAAVGDAQQSFKMKRSQGVFLGDIAPLRDPSPAQPEPKTRGKLYEKKNYFRANEHDNPNALPGPTGDPLAPVGRSAASKPPSQAGPPLFPGLSFEGIYDGQVFPPDPTGDIGKDHYVQSVNRFSSGGQGAWLQIWDKEGQSVLGPVRTIDKLWNQVGATSIGDPIVQYDHAAQRWLFMEMNNFGSNDLLLAISNTSDPTGAWKAYRFACDGFPDYPKLYVWHDSYLVTVNEIGDAGNLCSGYALERSALLAGEDAFGVYRFELPKFQGIQYQPATGGDWEGGAPPPPGTPGYVFRIFDDSWSNVDPDHLQVYKIFVNWQNIDDSHVEGPQKILVTPFESTVCWDYFLECVEQPGPPGTPRISAQDQIIMYRVPYRNYGSYEAVVLNHISDVSGQVGKGGDAAIRWYELRKPTGADDWQIYQAGTFAPDSVNRFMGTLSLDATGNIGLGYTVCNTETFPGIRLTGHRTSDPLGSMNPEEYSLIEGGASHGTLRWGDYSVMSVDPMDGRTFWFTAEYQPEGRSWGSRIASFILRRDTFDTRPKSLEAPTPSPFLTTAEPVTVLIYNEGLEPATDVSVTLKLEGAVVATEQVAGSIPAGGGVTHTFAPTVNLSTPGKTYNFDLITHYTLDQYALNDSIRVQVRKLTSNDAAVGGKPLLGGVVCSAEHQFDFLLKNAAGLPLDSADIRYRATGDWQSYRWRGHLAPGAIDTVSLPLSGVKNGANFLTVITENPNGQPDEDVHNDTVIVKFIGQITASPILITGFSTQGKLRWEIREKTNNALLFTGDFTTGQLRTENYCLADGKCFRLVLKGQPIEWVGNFELFDMFGQRLVKREYIAGEEIIEICQPERKQVDVGVFALVSPVTAPDLGSSEAVTLAVRNYGETPQTGVPLRYRLDGGAWQNAVLPGTLQPGETDRLTFPGTVDLGVLGRFYHFEAETTLAGDEQPQNDGIKPVIYHQPPFDVGIAKLDINRACANPNDVEVGLTFRNNGTEWVDSIRVADFVNGVPGAGYTLYGAVPPGGETGVSYPIAVPGFGDFDLRIEVTDVHGQGKDFTAENDTASRAFSLIPNGFPVFFFAQLDGKPQETRWELLDWQGNVVVSGGPYLPSESFISQTWCLMPDSCYTFNLYDSGADGMQGNFFISNQEGPIWDFQGGNFGDQLTKNFCAVLPCAGFSAEADVTNPSSPSAQDGSFVIHASGGTPPYLFSLDNAIFTSDSLFTGLAAGLYVVYLQDSNFCQSSLTIQVGTSAAGEIVQNRALRLSPNPTQGIVRAELPALPGEHEAVAEVFDGKGRFVFAVRLTRWDDTLSGLFSLEKFAPGNYFIRVKGSDKAYFGIMTRQ